MRPRGLGTCQQPRLRRAWPLTAVPIAPAVWRPAFYSRRLCSNITKLLQAAPEIATGGTHHGPSHLAYSIVLGRRDDAPASCGQANIIGATAPCAAFRAEERRAAQDHRYQD